MRIALILTALALAAKSAPLVSLPYSKLFTKLTADIVLQGELGPSSSSVDLGVGELRDSAIGHLQTDGAPPWRRVESSSMGELELAPEVAHHMQTAGAPPWRRAPLVGEPVPEVGHMQTDGAPPWRRAPLVGEPAPQVGHMQTDGAPPWRRTSATVPVEHMESNPPTWKRAV
ncbi:hypothetical protein FB45DRAFT_865840 [Roridomyces roridus]|uniref:Uncharacterized protein n=1 Tax=Roridomyces roridus TaxID=1738132 RepID=A0AAD7C085_9AGAR|nr:hypothetical protein FB45DRAFT_865840 [Roridomyces roridus]